MTDWNRKTWQLATPIMLANISLPLLGAVDTAVVGHLPDPRHIGAVAVSSLVFSLVYAGLNFLRMGTTGLTAQSQGAGTPGETRAWLARAGMLSVVLGIVLIVFQLPISWLAFSVIAPSDQVRPLAAEYFSIRIWGAPAALLNFAVLGWFFGLQKMRAALLVQIAMNGVNIILDIWFVLGLGWGVAGVAWATLISEVGASVLAVYIAVRYARRVGGHWSWGPVLDRLAFTRMLRVNGDIFLRSMFLQAAFIVFTSVGARSGDAVLAANAVLLNFQIFMAYALDAFANAAEVLVGEAYGERNRARLRAAFLATGRWAVVFSIAFSLLFLGAGGWIIDVLTGIQEIRLLARNFLWWAALSPIVSVWSFHFDGVFIGATRTAEMRNGMLISLLFYVVSLAILLPPMGNHGLWAAFMVFMAARGLTLAIRYPALERSAETHTG